MAERSSSSCSNCFFAFPSSLIYTITNYILISYIVYRRGVVVPEKLIGTGTTGTLGSLMLCCCLLVSRHFLYKAIERLGEFMGKSVSVTCLGRSERGPTGRSWRPLAENQTTAAVFQTAAARVLDAPSPASVSSAHSDVLANRERCITFFVAKARFCRRKILRLHVFFVTLRTNKY